MVVVAYVNKSHHVVFPIPENMLLFAWKAAYNFLVESRCLGLCCPLWCGIDNSTEYIRIVHISNQEYMPEYTVFNDTI